MKMIYDKKTGILTDATEVFVGDIDPLVHITDQEQAEEILLQNRPLVQKDVETEEKCEGALPRPERFGVWICYITDNHGDPIMVKLVSTDVQAHEWILGRPRTIGLIDDGTRGNRFVEYHTVEVE